MQTTRLISALASAAFLIGTAHVGTASAQTAPTTPPMQMTVGPIASPAGVPGTLALDARGLRARRTAAGYTLSGQALVKDACQAARFDPSLLTIFPPQLNLVQFRRPGTMGMLCIMRVIWVTAQPRTVTSAHPPAYVTVRTQKGVTRVPIR
jgi:hypothetical protein